MKKILFFDVDGTLFNSEKKLPSSAKEALFQARANGHEIAIATGRAPFMIADLLQELEINTYITFNGQYVVHNGQVLFKNGIEMSVLKRIIEFGETRNEPVVFLDDQRMIASVDGNPAVLESLQTLKYPYPAIDSTYYMKKSIYQTLIFMEEQDEMLYREKFPEVEFVRWHKFSCDILPKGGSKAKGIQLLLEKTGRSLKNAIAFGDGLNDIEMLQTVGLGVAMGNGHDKVKAVANFIAGHVDEDGLAHAMKDLGLI